ncbi:trypsin-like serine peptidase [Falsiroseomonas sp. HW251]|uniref:trypsin-like serine peptidase n=1 Tax=Falsiroseomonas sp. HW251 TaxID=3390998 RepID=UPI003D30F29C
MSTTYARERIEFETDQEAADTTAPEAAADFGTSETGDESAASEADDRVGHERMSNAGTTGGSPAQGNEGGLDSESAALEAGEESEFETDTEWSPESRFPGTENESAEAVVDAFFAEAASNPEEAQEFLPILAALAPVIASAVPALIGAFGNKGAPAPRPPGAPRPPMAGKPPQALAQLSQAARLLLNAPGLPPALKPLLQQILARREVSEAEAMGGADETDPVDALQRAAQVAEVVIGVDDRRRVTPTTSTPWNRVAHLRIRASNGQLFLGTGFFINKRTIATAGHCVFMPSQGGWAKEITVTQGRDAAATPYGTVTANSFRTVRGWAVGRRREYDYGAIILPRSYTQRASSFGFAAFGDSELRGRKLNLAGYPGDKPSGTLWYHGRVATKVSDRVITYDIDTAGGQSGSPVWVRSGSARTVVGIHTNGAVSGNSATRITRPVFGNLMAWRQEGE